MSISKSSYFSDRLRKLRKANQLTQKEAAKLIDVPESTYKDWENGAAIRGEPYPQIAKVFGVTLDELFEVSTNNDSISNKAHSIALLAQAIIDQVKK